MNEEDKLLVAVTELTKEMKRLNELNTQIKLVAQEIEEIRLNINKTLSELK